MNLYLMVRNNPGGYDTFSSVVVAARSKREARLIHPWGKIWPNWTSTDTWVHPSQVKVTYLGQAKPGTKMGVICRSFNAG